MSESALKLISVDSCKCHIAGGHSLSTFHYSLL